MTLTLRTKMSVLELPFIHKYMYVYIDVYIVIIKFIDN